jgi:hypothetical protein
MRRYDDPVEVRKGPVGDGVDDLQLEGPAQFLWRGKLWKVRAVLAHWVETGSWWQSADARAAIGTDDYSVVEEGAPAPVTRPGDRTGDRTGTRTGTRTGDLLEEREFWRVEAGDSRGGGVFDLSFDWSDGSWQLVGCVD